MGTTTNQIESHIEKTRDTLGSNIQELENKVKSATDWRQQFQKNPMTMIGIAFGGGVLLATMMSGPRRRRRPYPTPDIPGGAHRSSDNQKNKALETWDSIKGALMGVAATRVKDYVNDVIPGFKDHFQQAESTKHSTTLH